MSSVDGHYSQVAPFKRWVASAQFYLYDKTGAVTTVSVPANAVLVDMGKTQFATAAVAPATTGAVLRKVALAPANLKLGATFGSGYIYLSDAVPSAQKAVALN
jgi:hypothetical protein